MFQKLQLFCGTNIMAAAKARAISEVEVLYVKQLLLCSRTGLHRTKAFFGRAVSTRLLYHTVARLRVRQHDAQVGAGDGLGPKGVRGGADMLWAQAPASTKWGLPEADLSKRLPVLGC